MTEEPKLLETEAPTSEEQSPEDLEYAEKEKLFLQEQCYLLMGANKLVRKNAEPQDFSYKNFTILEGDKSALFSSNLLARSGVDKLFELTPAQMSSLVPRIRLFKSFPKESTNDGFNTIDAEFLFSNYFDDNVFYDSTKAKSSEVGIKSFSYTFDGGDPASKWILDAKLVLTFRTLQDIQAVCNTIDIGNNKKIPISFIDLIRPPKFNSEESGDPNNTWLFDPEYHVLKIVVGWARPQGDVLPKELLENLEGFNSTYIITLIDHEIDLKYDGSFEISMSYRGNIDTMFLSPKTDILSSGDVVKKEKELEDLRKRKSQSSALVKDFNNMVGKSEEVDLTNDKSIEEFLQKENLKSVDAASGFGSETIEKFSSKIMTEDGKKEIDRLVEEGNSGDERRSKLEILAEQTASDEGLKRLKTIGFTPEAISNLKEIHAKFQDVSFGGTSTKSALKVTSDLVSAPEFSKMMENQDAAIEKAGIGVKEARLTRYSNFLNDIFEAGRVFYVEIPEADIVSMGNSMSALSRARKQLKGSEADLDRAISEFRTNSEKFPSEIRRLNSNEILGTLIATNFEIAEQTGKLPIEGTADFKISQAQDELRYMAKVGSGAPTYEEELLRKKNAKIEAQRYLDNNDGNFFKASGDILSDAIISPFLEEAEIVSPKRIEFVFLGDILEAALVPLRKIDIPFFQNVKILIGNIHLYGPDGRYQINIADLPVSVKLFTEWFMRTVISKHRPRYLLRTFISDLVRLLIPAAQKGQCFEQTIFEYTDIEITNFVLPPKEKEEPLSKILVNSPLSANNRLSFLDSNVCEALKTLRLRNFNTSEPDFNYLLINATTIDRNVMKEPDSSIDFEQGIYHFWIGNGKGLLKDVNFKKSEISSNREANILRYNDTNNPRVIRNYYDTVLKLEGNFLFMPGQYFFLNPTLFGFGNPGSVSSMAYSLGIGGYYKVLKVEGELSRDKFETTITGKWEDYLGEKYTTNNGDKVTFSDLEINTTNTINSLVKYSAFAADMPKAKEEHAAEEAKKKEMKESADSERKKEKDSVEEAERIMDESRPSGVRAF